jgi:hypothetical protein
MAEDSSAQKKKQYHAPAITLISLRPEEAVLGNCKSASVSGPVAPTCSQTSCSSIGS